jgi:hypothetical protein
MISFAKIMRKMLTERMSFGALFGSTEQGRIDRADDVNVKPLRVTTMGDDEAWTFSYKSDPSTTQKRWSGYIRFFKEDVSHKDDAMSLDCQVDCRCPDYCYRWAYANHQQDAGPIGPKSLNQCVNAPPDETNPRQVPGLCKHLAALKDYLWERIEPEKPVPPSLSKLPNAKDDRDTSIDTDTYSDSRSGTIQEAGTSRLYERIDRFVKTCPQFDVPYEE